MHVRERRLLERREERRLPERLAPALGAVGWDVAPMASDRVLEGDLEGVFHVAAIPEEGKAAAGAEHAVDLGERLLAAEPMERLRHRDRVDAPVVEWDRLRGAVERFHGRRELDELRPHRGERLDREHAGAGRSQHARELSRPCAEIQHVASWPDPHALDEPCDRLGRKPGARALVHVRDRVERLRGRMDVPAAHVARPYLRYGGDVNRVPPARAPLVVRFRERLPLPVGAPLVTLGEGSTPLLAAPRLSEGLGVELLLKWEGANPTGSFKDRGMTVALSAALAEGARAVVCASTGNTAASAAAYAARAGVRAVVLQPAGAVALGKLAQARAVGARVLEVQGSFDAALAAARELAARGTHALVNSLNPYRVHGQKTAAWEIVEEIAEPPDVLALPYGGGGNTRAYALGFEEAGAGVPQIVAGQAASRPETNATAIRIAKPAHREEAERAIAASGGSVVSLADDEIFSAWRSLAELEGVFCEPSSAAGLAALERERPAPGSRVVCVITGHGLKDPDAVGRVAPELVSVEADADAIARAAQ